MNIIDKTAYAYYSCKTTLKKYYSKRQRCFHGCNCGSWKTKTCKLSRGGEEFINPSPYCPYKLTSNNGNDGCPMLYEARSFNNAWQNRDKWKSIHNENKFYEYVTNILPHMEEKCNYFKKIENNHVSAKYGCIPSNLSTADLSLYVNKTYEPTVINKTEQYKKDTEDLGIFIKNLEDEEKILHKWAIKIKRENEK